MYITYILDNTIVFVKKTQIIKYIITIRISKTEQNKYIMMMYYLLFILLLKILVIVSFCDVKKDD